MKGADHLPRSVDGKVSIWQRDEVAAVVDVAHARSAEEVKSKSE
jgi:hypothetical protein